MKLPKQSSADDVLLDRKLKSSEEKTSGEKIKKTERTQQRERNSEEKGVIM